MSKVTRLERAMKLLQEEIRSCRLRLAEVDNRGEYYMLDSRAEHLREIVQELNNLNYIHKVYD